MNILPLLSDMATVKRMKQEQGSDAPEPMARARCFGGQAPRAVHTLFYFSTEKEAAPDSRIGKMRAVTESLTESIKIMEEKLEQQRRELVTLKAKVSALKKDKGEGNMRQDVVPLVLSVATVTRQLCSGVGIFCATDNSMNVSRLSPINDFKGAILFAATKACRMAAAKGYTELKIQFCSHFLYKTLESMVAGEDVSIRERCAFVLDELKEAMNELKETQWALFDSRDINEAHQLAKDALC